MVALLGLVLALTGSSAELADVDRFFHLDPGTSEKLPSDVQKGLAAALADFRAVQSGRAPVNAKPDTETPEPADGGTTFWVGRGYQLTVVKSLASLGEIDGYMYGPILRFSPSLIVGNGDPISSVMFYPAKELRSLQSGS